MATVGVLKHWKAYLLRVWGGLKYAPVTLLSIHYRLPFDNLAQLP